MNKRLTSKLGFTLNDCVDITSKPGIVGSTRWTQHGQVNQLTIKKSLMVSSNHHRSLRSSQRTSSRSRSSHLFPPFSLNHMREAIFEDVRRFSLVWAIAPVTVSCEDGFALRGFLSCLNRVVVTVVFFLWEHVAWGSLSSWNEGRQPPDFRPASSSSESLEDESSSITSVTCMEAQWPPANGMGESGGCENLWKLSSWEKPFLIVDKGEFSAVDEVKKGN